MSWSRYVVTVDIAVEAENDEQARRTIEMVLREEFGHGYDVVAITPAS